jgi:threonine aldolase
VIELRSDTFTRPTPDMLLAMTTAPLGDDVYGEDPTVARLERLAADRLGKEAGLLLPSGTMANLTAVLAHCPRGSTAIMGAESDLYLYEAHGGSVLGGVGYQPVPNLADGTLDPSGLAAAFPEDPDDPQFALPALICLENTQNRCGGVPLSPAYQAGIAALARAHGLGLHLDGARVFNAALALRVAPAELAAAADTVQFCLSKGLSAPVGSMLVGTAELVGRARRLRKLLGGGMRQAGVLAAAGIVALEEMTGRLAEDHAHARRLAEGLAVLPGIELDPAAVVTNIVLFRIRDPRWSPESLVPALGAAGVAVAGFGPGRIRAVTHAGVSRADVDRAVEITAEVLKA